MWFPANVGDGSVSPGSLVNPAFHSVSSVMVDMLVVKFNFFSCRSFSGLCARVEEEQVLYKLLSCCNINSAPMGSPMGSYARPSSNNLQYHVR